LKKARTKTSKSKEKEGEEEEKKEGEEEEEEEEGGGEEEGGEEGEKRSTARRPVGRGRSARGRCTDKRNRFATSFKETKVTREIPEQVKCFLKSGLVNHSVGVSADGKDFSSWKRVVVIESKREWVVFDCASVYHCLLIVFTIGLELKDFPASIRRAKKCDITHLAFKALFVDGDGAVLDQPRVLETTFLGQTQKVIPIQCTA
jgi:hypothetical protein